MKLKASLLVLFIMFISFWASAQIGLEGVSSGRYEIRKSVKRTPSSEKEAIIVYKDKPKAEVLEQKEQESKLQNPAVLTGENQLGLSENEKREPSLSDQAQSLFSKEANKINDYYREHLEPGDIRRNRLELDILPTVVGINSSSNYSFRDYRTEFNALQVNANMWLTPLIGFSGKYLFSVGADLDAMSVDRSRVPARFELMDLGLSFRKFTGSERESDSLEVSILYGEGKLSVPNDSANRAKLKSGGIGIGIRGRFQSADNYAWIIGGTLYPRLQHSEIATAANFSSGTVEDSLSLKFEIGGAWIFSRESQMVWGISTTVEKNTFSGSATAADPLTNLKPSNVGVSNNLQMFTLGYRWGR